MNVVFKPLVRYCKAGMIHRFILHMDDGTKRVYIHIAFGIYYLMPKKRCSDCYLWLGNKKKCSCSSGTKPCMFYYRTNMKFWRPKN